MYTVILTDISTIHLDMTRFGHLVGSDHGLLAPSYEGMVPPSFR